MIPFSKTLIGSMTTSNLVPVDGGGGSAGSQFFDDTDLLQGNDDMNVILKELGM